MRQNALRHTRALNCSFSTCIRVDRRPLLLQSWHNALLLKASRELRSTSDTRNLLSHRNHEQRKDSYGEIQESTIYALSTAPGRAGIAIVRISGSQCLDVYRALCPTMPLPKPRFASLRTLYDPASGSSVNILDSDALVLYFPAPHTVTGEDVLEFHIHGGLATVKAVLISIAQCASTASIRYAEPGEFTKRAFQNGRLDLAQVEALSDTLSAETEQQRRIAVRGNSGTLGRVYEGWRKQLLEARGELEAIIDFSEDQDFDTSNTELLGNIDVQVSSIVSSISEHEDASHCGELLRKGIRVAMVGHPNAGKSSLLNLIIGREASIVSTEAGTTRDIVEVGLDINGYLCTFADTAGLRSSNLEDVGNKLLLPETVGEVEAEGIRRAKAKAINSDVVLVIVSVELSPLAPGWTIRYDLEALKIAAGSQKVLIIVNKKDLISECTFQHLLGEFRELLSGIGLDSSPETIISVSCLAAQRDGPSIQDSGQLKHLVDRLSEIFKSMTVVENEHLLGVTERQRQLLQDCRELCQKYMEEAAKVSPVVSDLCEGDFDIVLAAEYLRSAANCLSRITGRGEVSDVEEVLGVVFEKFCVGK